MTTQTETGCCPRFDSIPWQEKEVTWKDKLFIKDHVTSLFHIPINFGKVVVRNMNIIEKEKAYCPDNLMLSDEKSLWGSDLYFAIDKEVPNVQLEKISGTFLTKVFEGPYQNMGQWIKDMTAYVASKGKEMKKLYFWYTTCPKCAKTYGKNYIVLFAQV